jgi:hypothetical protein
MTTPVVGSIMRRVAGTLGALLLVAAFGAALVACSTTAPAPSPARTSSPTPAPPSPSPSRTPTATVTGVGVGVGSATVGSGSVGPGRTVTPAPPGSTPTATPAPSGTAAPTPTPLATPAPPAAAGPGVYGLVTIGPTCPVQRIDNPCPDRAYAGTLSFQDAAGREVARVTADQDGQYVLHVAPGTYHVVPLAPAGSPYPRGVPADVTVTPGAWSRLDIVYDSGIR